MNKILLVEDDEDKREQILSFIKNKFKINVDEARSYTSAINAIRKLKYDLILLDMTMPTFDITASESGGRAQAFAGELILDEMKRKNIISQVIVVTQFDLFGEGHEEISLFELDNKLKKSYEKIYLGAVQYSISYTSWQETLEDKINLSKLR